MKRLPVFLVIALAFLCAIGFTARADYITANVVITNLPANGNTIEVVGATTRTWTNNIAGAPSTQITATNTIALSATNLINHLTKYPTISGYYLSMSTPTNVLIRGYNGAIVVVNTVGGWAEVTYTTNTTTRATLVRVPNTVEYASNRAEIASEIVNWLALATNSSATNATFLGNYLSKGVSSAGATQKVLNPVQFGSVETYTLRASNVFITNVIGHTVTITNLSLPGSGLSSLQIGTGANAQGDISISIGENSASTNNSSIAIGSGAVNWGQFTVALGSAASVETNYAMAIGDNSTALGLNSIAFGVDATASHLNSIAIGPSAATVADNDFILGNSGHNVQVPGLFEPVKFRNGQFIGTNRFDGRVAYLIQTITSLANGNNTMPILTNYFVDITTGPTEPFAICSIPAGYNGQVVMITTRNGNKMTVANESGFDATAANRISTQYSTDISFADYGSISLRYDSGLSRWVVIGAYGNYNLNSSVMWQDSAFSGLLFSTVPADAPTRVEVDTGTGIYGIGFNHTAAGDFAMQFPHGTAITNSIFPSFYVNPHLHLSVTNIPAGTSNAMFVLKYQIAPVNQFYSGITGTVTNTLTFTNTIQHRLLNFGFITNNALSGKDSIIARGNIQRIDSGAGDLGNSVYVIVDSLDFHVPLQQNGTTNIFGR